MKEYFIRDWNSKIICCRVEELNKWDEEGIGNTAANMEERTREFEDKNLEMIETEGKREWRSWKNKTFYKNC